MSVVCNIVDCLEKWELPCLFKTLFHVECPGCGIQRAFVALLRGDFMGSLRLYPALIPIMVMMGLLAVHLLRPLKHGAAALKYLFIFNMTVVIVSYLCKIL